MTDFQTSSKKTGLEIAIIGMACRFPGANNIDEFWRNLREGVESISFFSDEELQSRGIESALLSNPNYVKAGSVLEGSDLFDASFFDFNPREAETLDPQHRLFLESAWEALENAGYDPDKYNGSIGVYAGARRNHYLSNLQSNPLLMELIGEYQANLATNLAYLTTRVSYKMNLKGPSLSIQTACSTSLVAVHLACQSLLSGECEIALAGGVAINVSQKEGYLYQPGLIYSPDGHCRAFDAKAQGTISGNGLGIVVLKRLADALADGDCIHAVIKGTAIDNDGSLKVGFTAPSVDGQARVIRAAHIMAEIEANSISYIETHGTGTELGDPIEIAGLTKAFQTSTQKKGLCAIGSVKTNLGHLSAAAGIASLIKTVLSLKNKMLPPSLHFEKPNPNIDFENSPFYVNTKLSEWKPGETPRRAGVSSFGMGGTNAHVVLEEAPFIEAFEKSRPWQLLLISAKTSTALDTITKNLVKHLKQHPNTNIADFAYTLKVGRRAFNHRRIAVCRDFPDAVTTLETLEQKRVRTSFQEPINRDIVFLFSGQGAQYVNMGLELYKTESIFQEQIDSCSEILRSHLSFDLRDILYPKDKNVEAAARKLNQTFITQPALFVLEYALAKLWMAWGIDPKALIGHSIGEYVAACLAGVFSLEDALSLVATRGRLMQELPSGSMLAVFLSENDIRPFLSKEISLAAINNPSLCVVSGKNEAVKDLAKQLAKMSVDSRYLHTSHAFHSTMMEPILAGFEAQTKRFNLNPPRIPFVSNISGKWISTDEAINPDYWVRHLRQTVRFSDGIKELLREPNRVFLEVGPGNTLSMLTGQHPGKVKEQIVLSSLPHPKEKKSDTAFILNTLGQLWLAGIEADWPKFYADEKRRRIPLPTYPFERKRYWVERKTKSYTGGIQPIPQEQKPDIDYSKDESLQETETLPKEESITSSLLHSRPTLSSDCVAPEDDVQRTIARIWQELLGIDQVGIHDNFFELGGHSLLATQIIYRLRDAFRVEVPLRSLLELTTVAKLSAEITQLKNKQAPVSQVRPLVSVAEQSHLPFPLTDIQQAYWVGRSGFFELGNVATHFYVEVESSNLDLERFNAAWQQLIERHDMLRAIVLQDGQQQILAKVPPYNIEVLDLRGHSPKEIETELEAIRQIMSHQVLKCDQWPLFEIRASRLDNHRFRLHFSFDALICDAWSKYLFFREWYQLYQNPGARLAPIEISFRDYVLAEEAIRDSELYKDSLNYWLSRLSTLPPPPELPLARNPGSVTQPRFVSRRARLGSESWLRLKNRSRKANLTTSGLLVAAFAEVLKLWSKNPHFTINLTLFNRLPLHPQVNDIVGDFTSLTLLEVDSAMQDNFEDQVKLLQEQLWNDLDHRYVSGVQVMRELAKNRNRKPDAQMPVVFTSVLAPDTRSSNQVPMYWMGDLVYSNYQTPQVWLDSAVREEGEELVLSWNAVEDLFPEGMLDDMFNAYQGLLHHLADEEDSWHKNLHEIAQKLLPTNQLEQLTTVNATDAPMSDGLLHTLFAEQVKQRPDHPAVVGSNRTLTYEELHRHANQIGHWLQKMGARPNTLVAVVMEKGWEQVVAVLGILASGAAYLPIDAGLPKERLLYLLEHGKVDLVLTQSWIDEKLEWPESVQRLCVNTEGMHLDSGDRQSWETLQGEEDLAYVIYTSGSTGQPKGVMIDHRGAVNTILDINQRFGIGPDDRVLALSSLSFDLSVYDVFGTLAAGGTIVIPEASGTKDPAHWAELMNQEGVTIWNSVPALMELLVEYVTGRPNLLPRSLRLVLMSGDWIPVTLPGQIREMMKNGQVISLGGATEASIWSILYPINEVDSAWKSIPYGKPMLNQRFYVLNNALELCPVWVPGQLYIGGIGLAKGYWQDEEKTRASFISHPRTGERLYRTGDLGRYLSDGNIEFLGREDFQVKIQGHRIELGEIEAALVQHKKVRAAAVSIADEKQRNKRLVAYVVPSREPTPAVSDLRQFLQQKLPEYMVPSAYVLLDELPLTPNGKVNRQALPAPFDVNSEHSEQQKKNKTSLNTWIGKIIGNVLKLDQIDHHDNLIYLGANSVDMIRITNRLEQELNFRPKMDDFYNQPSVAGLVELYQQQQTNIDVQRHLKGPTNGSDWKDFEREEVEL